MPGIDFLAGAQETALFGLSVRNIAPPAPTTGPNLYPNALGIRQEATVGDPEVDTTSETCAWFSHTVDSLGWEALQCEEPCTTSGTLFGCEVIPPTCIDFRETQCTNTVSAEPWCCDPTFPYCITGILEQDGNTFTAFRCGNEALSGEMDIYDDTTTRVTTTLSSEGDEPTTVTVVGTPTDAPNDDDSNSDDNTSDDTNNPGSSDGSEKGSSGGGNSAPVGAIVGGVIGGIALIVGVAFAIWFIRFQKKKQANKAPDSGMEPYRYDPSTGYAGGYPSGYDYSQQGGYNPNAPQQQQGQYGMGVLPPSFSQAGSPKPEEQQMQQVQQAPVEMPGYSNYGAPSELPSEGTSGMK